MKRLEDWRGANSCLKMRGKIKSLNLGASVAPRMAHAASHNQVSNVEIERCSSD